MSKRQQSELRQNGRKPTDERRPTGERRTSNQARPNERRPTDERRPSSQARPNESRLYCQPCRDRHSEMCHALKVPADQCDCKCDIRIPNLKGKSPAQLNQQMTKMARNQDGDEP